METFFIIIINFRGVFVGPIVFSSPVVGAFIKPKV